LKECDVIQIAIFMPRQSASYGSVERIRVKEWLD